MPPAASLRYDQIAATRCNEVGNNFLSKVRKASHAAETSDGDPTLSSLIPGRTFEHNSADVQERELAEQVATALVVDFGHYKSTHKTIAQKAKASPETVKRWLAGENLPSFVYIMRLRPHSPSLRRLLALENDLSPDFQRELSELIQRHIR